jgi:hypothetical protein
MCDLALHQRERGDQTVVERDMFNKQYGKQHEQIEY